MPDLETHITGLIEKGCFFFKDSPHYLYSNKKTTLLEETLSYITTLPSNIKEITDVRITIDGQNIEIPFGWGSLFGVEWGGPSSSTNNKFSFRMYDSDQNPIPVLGPTERLTYKAEIFVSNPIRDIQLLDEDSQEITISYTSSKALPNCFGVNYRHTPDKKYLVEIYQQSAYDENNVLVDFDVHKYNGGSDTSQSFSIETTRNTMSLSLASIRNSYDTSNPIGLPTVDTNLLEYLRLDDVVWLEYIINLIEINNTVDLPVPTNVAKGTVFKIMNPLDSNYGKYFVLDSNNDLVMKETLPRTKNAKFRILLEEVPGTPGQIRQVSTIYMRPIGFSDLDYWDQSRIDTELPQALMSFFDGIPAGTKIYTNRTRLIVEDLLDNTLIIKSGTPPDNDDYTPTAVADNTILVDNYYHADGKQKFYAEGIKLNSNPKCMLLGEGVDFTEDNYIYFWQMSKQYKLPDDYVESTSPIIITDLLSSDVDIQETTCTEFKLKGDEILINRANNKIVNPTFLKNKDGVVVPFNYSNVTFEKDQDKTNSLLHEKSAKLTGVNSYISQHIPGIIFDTDYCFSLFAKSNLSSIKVTVYCFSNKGVPLENSPEINVSTEEDLEDNAWYDSLKTYVDIGNNRYLTQTDFIDYVNTIEYSPLLMTETFEKVVARMTRFDNFNKSEHREFTTSDVKFFAEDVTDIVIEVENVTVGNNCYIDCLQFEATVNPSEFSHSYDYAVIEYESSTRLFTPRFLVGSLDNRLNKGFLVLNIDSKEDVLAITPLEAVVYSSRLRILLNMDKERYGKMYGKNKWRHVGRFSNKRAEHLGEYFLYPKLQILKYLNFIPEPLFLKQKTLMSDKLPNNLYLLAEDEFFKNIPGLNIKLLSGYYSGVYSDIQTIKTGDDGTAVFSLPDILQETLSPLIEIGFTSSSSGRRLGYEISSGNIIGHTPVLNDRYCIMTESGKHSNVMRWNGNLYNGLAVPGEVVVIDDLYSQATEQEYYIPISSNDIPIGFIEYPIESIYDITIENSGSVAFSYMSGLFNNEIPVSTYNNTLPSSIVLSRSSTTSYSEFSFNPINFNPVETSIKITDPSSPSTIYTLSRTNLLQKNQFIVDRINNKLLIDDLNLTSIQVEFIPNLVYVSSNNRRRLYFHRSILFKIFKDVYNKIDSSSLKTQHEQTLPSALGTVTKLTPVSFPLYIRTNFNVDVYVSAQSGTRIKESKVTYVHNKILI